MRQPTPSRRETIKALAALTALGPISSAAHAQRPSNLITLGFIGVGWHGHDYNLQSFLQQDDCRAVAVCDVFPDRRDRAAGTIETRSGNADVKKYPDFRDLLADDTIDAVVISTPDHWHVPMSLAALAAGKDVMCEKPTLTIAEGRTLADTVAGSDRVFATGLEDRSLQHYHRLAEIVRNGGIGKLRRIHVGIPAGEAYPLEDPAPVPHGFDWNLWLGPAPWAPYSPTRTEPMVWRNIRDYSGGLLTDWGAHLMDTAQVANFAEHSGPVEVEGRGDVPVNSMSTRPSEYNLTYRYANGVVMTVESTGPALRFEGDDGWVGNNGWRGRLEASDESILRATYDPASNKLWPRPVGEHRNFLDCIRSRQAPTYTAETIHRLSTAMHIGNISTELGRPLRWNPDAESFVNDAEADGLRSRESRDWA